MFHFIVRVTSSFILLGTVIYIHQSLPNTAFYNDLVVSLLAFFFADGPLYWIQQNTDRISTDELREGMVVFLLIFQGVSALIGAAYLTFACRHLS
jgi:thiol:disulfide interchange protein